MTGPNAAAVGFIGLGAMGLPMALNLRKAGHPVLAWNRSQPALQAAAEAGCEIVADARGMADRCHVVIAMLPDLPQLAALLHGPTGLLAGDAMTHLVVMSTVSPVAVRALADELAVHNVRLIDAPVSGGTKGAHAGTLAISVGADQGAFETVQPYLQAMGGLVLRMGPIGAGSLTKACNQLVVAGTVAALAEAVQLGERGGLDIEPLLNIFGAGLAQSEVLKQKHQHYLTSDFTGGGPIDYLLKDLRIVAESGAATMAALPVTALLTQLCQAVVAQGNGRLDSSSLLQLLRQLSLPVSEPTAAEANQ